MEYGQVLRHRYALLGDEVVMVLAVNADQPDEVSQALVIESEAASRVGRIVIIWNAHWVAA